MHLSRPFAALIGVLTLLHLAYTFYLFISTFSAFAAIATGTRVDPNAAGEPFHPILALHLTFKALTALLFVFYIVHIIKCTAFPDSSRVLWVLVLLFAGSVGMSVYWALFVWSAPPVATPPAITQSPSPKPPAAT